MTSQDNPTLSEYDGEDELTDNSGDAFFVMVHRTLARLSDKVLPGGALKLYVLIKDFSKVRNGVRTAWPGEARLAYERGVTEQTIRNNLTILVELGLIEVERVQSERGKMYWHNRYTINASVRADIADDKSKRNHRKSDCKPPQTVLETTANYFENDSKISLHEAEIVSIGITTTINHSGEAVGDGEAQRPMDIPAATPPQPSSTMTQRQETNTESRAGASMLPTADYPLAETRYREMMAAAGTPVKRGAPLPRAIREYIGQLSARGFSDDEVNAAFDAAEKAGVLKWVYVEKVLERGHDERSRPNASPAPPKKKPRSVDDDWGDEMRPIVRRELGPIQPLSELYAMAEANIAARKAQQLH